MDIIFKNKKLCKIFNEERRPVKEFGAFRARLIKRRMAELSCAESLFTFWPPKSGPARCHELHGNLKGVLSIDLDHPYRLLFRPADSIPELAGGGLDGKRVKAVQILCVEDTHG